jgi:hypothetical protein
MTMYFFRTASCIALGFFDDTCICSYVCFLYRLCLGKIQMALDIPGILWFLLLGPFLCPPKLKFACSKLKSVWNAICLKDLSVFSDVFFFFKAVFCLVDSYGALTRSFVYEVFDIHLFAVSMFFIKSWNNFSHATRMAKIETKTSRQTHTLF